MKTRLGISAGLTLAILLFIAFFDNFTMIPMVSPYAASLGSGTVVAGWIVSMFSIANMAGNIGAGWILDRFGRRMPLVVAMIWAGFGVWLYGIVTTPLGLMGARAFHGLGGAVVVPGIYTLAADLAPEDKRSAMMGRIGAMIGLAAIIGPMYSGIMRQAVGPNAVFNSVLVAMLIGALLTLTLPETLSRAQEGKKQPKAGSVKLRTIPFGVMSAAGFGIAFYQGALTLLLPLQLEHLGYPAALSGSVFSLFAIVAVVAMTTVVRRWKHLVIARGYLFVALGFAALSLGSSLWITALGMATYGFGFGLIYPTLNTQIANMYSVHERGRAYGVFNAFYSLGVVAGPPVVGLLSGHVSEFVVYGLLAVIAGVGSFLLYYYRDVVEVTRSDNIGSAAA